MLYSYDVKILSALKKAQQSESDYVFLDLDTSRCWHCSGYYMSDVESAIRHDPDSHFKVRRGSEKPSLDHLIEQGCVARTAGSVYQVTHHGWFNRSVRAKEVLKLIVTHVVFPSAVAFITTLITLWISSKP